MHRQLPIQCQHDMAVSWSLSWGLLQEKKSAFDEIFAWQEVRISLYVFSSQKSVLSLEKTNSRPASTSTNTVSNARDSYLEPSPELWPQGATVVLIQSKQSVMFVNSLVRSTVFHWGCELLFGMENLSTTRIMYLGCIRPTIRLFVLAVEPLWLW